MNKTISQTIEARKGMELEFNVLRAEVLKRVEMRQQIMATTLTLTGIFLGLALTYSAIGFIYPFLAMFLAGGWAQNEVAIRRIGSYIRNNIEKNFPGMGWETFREQKTETRIGKFPYVILSPAGIILISEVITTGVGLYKFSYTLPEKVFLIIDVIAFLLTIATVERVRRLSNEFDPKYKSHSNKRINHKS